MGDHKHRSTVQTNPTPGTEGGKSPGIATPIPSYFSNAKFPQYSHIARDHGTSLQSTPSPLSEAIEPGARDHSMSPCEMLPGSYSPHTADMQTEPYRYMDTFLRHVTPPISTAPGRTISSMVRTRTKESEDEQEDLRIASSKNPTTLLELDLDGNIRYLGKTWECVVGTKVKPFVGQHISELIVGETSDKQIFNQAIDIMTKDDTSYRVKFVTRTERVSDIRVASDDESREESPNATLDASPRNMALDSGDDNSIASSVEEEFIEMEGQGVLIHDPKTQVPTHSMWLLKPFVPTNVELELPYELTDYLGFGADIFAAYLLNLNELGVIDENNVPPPKQVLCRICEQHVPAWFIERHSELCFVEHKAQDNVQQAHDQLVEHRNLILVISDSINRRNSRASSNPSGSSGSTPLSSSPLPSPKLPLAFSDVSPTAALVHDYKGIPLPSPSSTDASSGAAANLLLLKRHSVQYKRYPLKSLGILVELCDEALSINPGELEPETMEVAYSPGSEKAIKHAQNWKRLDSSDPAINILIEDTEALVQTKVDFILRYAASLQYSEKIKRETDKLVLQTVADTVEKIRDSTYSTSPHNYTTPMAQPITTALPDTEAVRMVHSPQPKKLNRSVYSNTSSKSELFFSDTYGDAESPQSEARLLSSPLNLRKDPKEQSKRSVTPTDVLLRGRPSRSSRSTSSDLLDSERAKSRSSYSPRRHLSPIPNYVSNSPMTSVQRISRGGSHGETPNDSPALSALEVSFHSGETRHNSGEVPQLHLPPGVVSDAKARPPLSPLLVSTTPSVRITTPSIRDYEIVKPISKGAFGSVFLAKRRLTGDFYAIKVLKKSDMIAKNQVMNIKSERAIMMAQSDSPYVAKLYATFQSNKYLFLVMEYMNGGDCAALLKAMVALPNEWAKKYVAEMIVVVTDLHDKGIIHRDLKPDNFLIDSKGHLKLTDFGLSKMGIVRRQDPRRRNSAMEPPIDLFSGLSMSESAPKGMALSLSPAVEKIAYDKASASSPTTTFLDQYMKQDRASSAGKRSCSGSSAADVPTMRPVMSASVASQSSFAVEDEQSADDTNPYALFDPQDTASNKKFVGTPDYLAPETITGATQSAASDWWSIGCILFEFLFGYPPFHAESAEKVFEQILSGKIEWPEDEVVGEVCAPAAKDLILKLLVLDPEQRLGSDNSDNIKRHPYFDNTNWNELWDEDRDFVPALDGPESTDYFDSRGAEASVFPTEGSDEEEFALPENSNAIHTTALGSPMMRNLASNVSTPPTPASRERRGSRLNDNFGEFGSFQFRNYTALDKANKDVINRLKTEHMEHRQSLSSASSDSLQRSRSRGYSFTSSPVTAKPPMSPNIHHQRVSSIASTFSSGDENLYYGEVSNPPTPVSPHIGLASLSASSGVAPTIAHISPVAPKATFAKPLLPSLTATSSASSSSPKPISALPKTIHQRSFGGDSSPSTSESEMEFRSSALMRIKQRRESSRRKESSFSSMSGEVVRPMFHKLDVVLCEPNTASRSAAEKLLHKLGCNAIVVATGDSLARKVTGEVKFDLIFTSFKLPNLDTSVDLAKLIRHTASINSGTPLVCVTRYTTEAAESSAFDLVIEQPLTEKLVTNTLMRFCNWCPVVSDYEEAISDSDGSCTPPVFNREG